LEACNPIVFVPLNNMEEDERFILMLRDCCATKKREGLFESFMEMKENERNQNMHESYHSVLLFQSENLWVEELSATQFEQAETEICASWGNPHLMEPCDIDSSDLAAAYHAIELQPDEIEARMEEISPHVEVETEDQLSQESSSASLMVLPNAELAQVHLQEMLKMIRDLETAANSKLADSMLEMITVINAVPERMIQNTEALFQKMDPSQAIEPFADLLMQLPGKIAEIIPPHDLANRIL
jgi:hypothetical protein